MSQTALANKEKTQIARPLPVLVPLIQHELSAGNRAGLEHYRQAGELLLEAREQVAPFKWGKWLAKNFELGRTTAHNYMKLAERIQADPGIVHDRKQTMQQVIRSNDKPAHAHWRPVFEATKKVDVDVFADVRQARTEELQLHRDLALELIDLGYKALATRLHPDRGGSRDAMRRLNRVRDELKSVAVTRRFE